METEEQQQVSQCSYISIRTQLCLLRGMWVKVKQKVKRTTVMLQTQRGVLFSKLSESGPVQSDLLLAELHVLRCFVPPGTM